MKYTVFTIFFIISFFVLVGGVQANQPIDPNDPIPTYDQSATSNTTVRWSWDCRHIVYNGSKVISNEIYARVIRTDNPICPEPPAHGANGPGQSTPHKDCEVIPEMTS